MHDVVELSLLDLAAKSVGVGEAVHQAGQPPAEALGFPDALEAELRIGVDARGALVLEVLDDLKGRLGHGV